MDHVIKSEKTRVWIVGFLFACISGYSNPELEKITGPQAQFEDAITAVPPCKKILDDLSDISFEFPTVHRGGIATVEDRITMAEVEAYAKKMFGTCREGCSWKVEAGAQAVVLKVRLLDREWALKFAGQYHGKKLELEDQLIRQLRTANRSGVFLASKYIENTPGLFGNSSLVMRSGGNTLISLVEGKEAITEDDFYSLADQILGGLATLEAMGIVHVDMKLGNCVVRRTENGWKLSIIDFGSATRNGAYLVDQEFIPFLSHGTSAYMPDRQFLVRSPLPHERTHQYSNSELGVEFTLRVPETSDDLFAVDRMLLEMLIGKRILKGVHSVWDLKRSPIVKWSALGPHNGDGLEGLYVIYAIDDTGHDQISKIYRPRKEIFPRPLPSFQSNIRHEQLTRYLYSRLPKSSTKVAQSLLELAKLHRSNPSQYVEILFSGFLSDLAKKDPLQAAQVIFGTPSFSEGFSKTTGMDPALKKEVLKAIINTYSGPLRTNTRDWDNVTMQVDLQNHVQYGFGSTEFLLWKDIVRELDREFGEVPVKIFERERRIGNP